MEGLVSRDAVGVFSNDPSYEHNGHGLSEGCSVNKQVRAASSFHVHVLRCPQAPAGAPIEPDDHRKGNHVNSHSAQHSAAKIMQHTSVWISFIGVMIAIFNKSGAQVNWVHTLVPSLSSEHEFRHAEHQFLSLVLESWRVIVSLFAALCHHRH